MMRETNGKRNWSKLLMAWVNGEKEPPDRTLFTMERRPPRPGQWERKEAVGQKLQRALRRISRCYPAGVAVVCVALTGILLAAVMQMPGAQTVAALAGTKETVKTVMPGIAPEQSPTQLIGYRGFDTLGEICVLFLAVMGVALLSAQARSGKKEMAVSGNVQKTRRAQVLILLLSGVAVIFGGGFFGGVIYGAALVFYGAAFRFTRTAVRSQERFMRLGLGSLGLYIALYGIHVFINANKLAGASFDGLATFASLAAGIVVGCAWYGLYAFFPRKEQEP